MSLVFSDRAALPCWAIVVALLTLSPLPQAFPFGIALGAIGLVGSALLLQQSRQREALRITLSPNAPRPWSFPPSVRMRRGRHSRMRS
jgi:hypothetical protein